MPDSTASFINRSSMPRLLASALQSHWRLRVGYWCYHFMGLALLVGYTGEVTADERVQFFEKHIRPVLIEHCYECHSNARGKSEGGLLLDSRPAMQRGGDSGQVIEAGHPDKSLLVEAIKHVSLEMPPDKQLDDETIRWFEEWIRQGAVDPRDQETTSKPTPGFDLKVAREFWAFQSRMNPSIPNPRADWNSSAIDCFILDKLQEEQLDPAEETVRATWIRRVTFDLIGLPPTVEQLDEFTADQRPDAYERVVDRLLASPHYGERWGRYWLDLARYADSNGADENHTYPVAWRYRDYVVSAYNSDKPYDRMVREQLAGDLMPAENEAERRENLTATGFLVLGPKMLAEQDKEKLVADIVDEQLDTFGKVFLGLTLGCARCHDHKFDPISAEDYYALAGVFHSTKTMEHLDHVSQWNERELPDRSREQKIAQHKVPLERATAQAEKLTVELRNIEFDRQLELLTRLMLKDVDGVIATGNENGIEGLFDEEASEEQLKPLIDFLSGGSGVLRIWNKLSTIPGEQFIDDAHRQWQALSSAAKNDESSNVAERFQQRLATQSAPRTQADLVANYVAAFKQCREDVQKTGDDELLWKALFGKRSVFDVQREPGLYLTSAQKSRLGEIQNRVDELTKATPAFDKVMAADESELKLVALHVRGNHLQMSGEPLPRSVPKVLESTGAQTDFPSQASGRLELAQWLTHPDHPLTARVMVNRIWQGHFGQGLVGSSSNFGTRGQEPTHPELLDWLADEFIRGDWSIKRMHRSIVLSSAFRMACSADPKSQSIDPENHFLSHFSRRRLELEPIRDALLTIAGQLDHQLGGEAKVMKGRKYEGSGVEKTVFDSPRRTLYLPINRAALDAVFSMFDYVDPAVSLEQRPTTIVPHQTLFLMNHPLVMDVGRQLAERVVADVVDFDRRIELVYKTSFARTPTLDERLIVEQFITTKLRDACDAQESEAELAAWTSFCRSLLLTNEFLYVE